MDAKTQAATALVCFATVIVGSVLTELAMRLTIVHGSPEARRWAITMVNGVFLPVCALAAFLASSLGWRALLVCAGTFAALWASLVRFRGLWAWSGTFDAYWLSPKVWLICALSGFALGLAPLPFRRAFRPMPAFAAYVALASLLAAALVEYVGGGVFYNSIESVYPETRHVFLIAIACVLGIGLFFGDER